MQKLAKRGVIAILLLSLAGCYHATVNTGQPASPQTIEKNWAVGWLYGLVPPSTVEAGQQCPNGVARVETKLSVPNRLAAWITAGIFTPMTIHVTCAAESQASNLPANQKVQVDRNASTSQIQKAFEKAADRVASTDGAVYMKFED